MQTFNRKCIKNYKITDLEGTVFKFKKGEMYITSKVKNDYVTVFSKYWVEVPVKIFHDEIEFIPKIENSHKKILNYIKLLKSNSFKHWNEDQENAYLTACISIEEFVKKM